MSDIQKRCKEKGHPVDTIAIGATPTFAFFENDQKHKITEAHPGNYVFFDATGVDLGVAKPENCALTVLAQVIDRHTITRIKDGKREKIRMVYVNAGSKILSGEKRPHGEGGLAYGKVFSDLEATTLNPDASLRSLSEEIGWMEVSPEKIPAIGKKIRLLAQHAGTTIACNPRAWLIDGEKVIGPAVIRA